MSEDLSDLRKKIDDIDNQMIALLSDRMKIVDEVGKRKTKASTGLSFIRPGREATMLRDLTKKAEGIFPAAAIATIWRMIISTSLVHEDGLSIAAYVSASSENCFWRAREYYGTFLPISKDSSTDSIIDNVAHNNVSVGILPLMDDSKEPWWIRPREEKNDIYIFARIPFISRNESAAEPALAIANVIPEPTADDISVLAIHTEKDDSAIKAAFAELGLEITCLINKGQDSLYETNKFVPIDDPILSTIADSLGKESVRLLGSYAQPITL